MPSTPTFARLAGVPHRPVLSPVCAAPSRKLSVSVQAATSAPASTVRMVIQGRKLQVRETLAIRKGSDDEDDLGFS
jgi:hypothetical protein